MLNPLSSPKVYEAFIYSLPERYPSIRRSTLVYIASGVYFGRVEGMVFFERPIILCAEEFLNFELGVIEGYGYEVTRPHSAVTVSSFPRTTDYCRANYPHKDKLYWYDSFPHPHIPALASTHPHHKHVHPDIKHNRIPTPDLSFTMPNLPFLIEEVQQTFLHAGDMSG